MIQSSTVPCLATILGKSDFGSNATGVWPSTVMKNSVGLLGLSGSTGFSEKYSFRVRTGATSPSHGRSGLGRGSEEPARVERGSGASWDTAILAIARLGSF